MKSHSPKHMRLLNNTLYCSIENGNLKLIRLMIGAGADIHDPEVIRRSVLSGNIKIVRELINAGIDIHNIYTLCQSAEEGHLEITQLFIDSGVDINMEDNYALCESAKNGHLEIVRLLMKAGASINDKNDLTLRILIKNGKFSMFNELTKHVNRRHCGYASINERFVERANHYKRIMRIMFDLPRELYDELGRFI